MVSLRSSSVPLLLCCFCWLLFLSIRPLYTITNAYPCQHGEWSRSSQSSNGVSTGRKWRMKAARVKYEKNAKSMAKFVAEACPAQPASYSCYFHNPKEFASVVALENRTFVSFNESSSSHCLDYHPLKFLELLPNKQLVLMGDSLMAQITTALVCSLYPLHEDGLIFMNLTTKFARQPWCTDLTCPSPKDSRNAFLEAIEATIDVPKQQRGDESSNDDGVSIKETSKNHTVKIVFTSSGHYKDVSAKNLKYIQLALMSSLYAKNDYHHHSNNKTNVNSNHIVFGNETSLDTILFMNFGIHYNDQPSFRKDLQQFVNDMNKLLQKMNESYIQQQLERNIPMSMDTLIPSLVHTNHHHVHEAQNNNNESHHHLHNHTVHHHLTKHMNDSIIATRVREYEYNIIQPQKIRRNKYRKRYLKTIPAEYDGKDFNSEEAEISVPVAVPALPPTRVDIVDPSPETTTGDETVDDTLKEETMEDIMKTNHLQFNSKRFYFLQTSPQHYNSSNGYYDPKLRTRCAPVTNTTLRYEKDWRNRLMEQIFTTTNINTNNGVSGSGSGSSNIKTGNNQASSGTMQSWNLFLQDHLQIVKFVDHLYSQYDAHSSQLTFNAYTLDCTHWWNF